MSRRFLVIAIVFVVGFGAGYGATWLFVGSPDKPAPAVPPATGTAPTTKEPVAMTTAPTAPTTATASAADAGPTAVEDAVAGDAVAAGAETAADDTTTTQPSETPGPDAAVAAAPDAAPNEPPQPDGPSATGDAAAWWNACHGKVCRVDWGRVSGGISVRKGELEHGQEVDWAKDFAKAEKAGTLEAKKNMRVEVIAVGMADGKPVAALIKHKKLRGIIALSFGDKSIRFEPLPD